MPSKKTIHLEGDKRVNKTLNEIGTKEGNKAMRKGMRTSQKAKTLVEVKRLTPVDTGAMKKGWKVRSAKSRKFIGMNVLCKDELFDNYYPKFITGGTKDEDGNWIIEPQRIVETAVENVGDEAIDLALNIIGDEILRHWEKP